MMRKLMILLLSLFILFPGHAYSKPHALDGPASVQKKQRKKRTRRQRPRRYEEVFDGGLGNGGTGEGGGGRGTGIEIGPSTSKKRGRRPMIKPPTIKPPTE
jgi:hypothetical protein